MVRTRIAPSPTGEDIHIGNLYTALINWAWAKKNKGKFIIRIEDTDRTRYVKGSEQKILQTLRAYGLDYDEGPDISGPFSPYRQSERLTLYKKYAEELIQKGAAYYCTCSRQRLDELRTLQQKQKQIPKYDKHCRNIKYQSASWRTNIKNRSYVIRLNVPENRDIVFNDVIRGNIKFNSNDLDDQVLLKSDGYPTYHLAVVVDDHLMEISHVIRAEEWLSSTPKHILLYEAFGWKVPIYAHVPILRNPDRSKLSKRKNPVWASWYLKQGYLPEAVLNYLALMGWSHPKQKEIFSFVEFVKTFDLKDIKSAGPAFDPVKLEWMNGEYIRKTQNSNLKAQIYEFYEKKYQEEIVEKTIPLIKERIKKLSDYLSLCEFFFKRPEKWEIDLSDKIPILKKIHQALKVIDDTTSMRVHQTGIIGGWTANSIGERMQDLSKREGIKTGEFFMTLRVAITGKKISPPLNESMEILGKVECLKRLEKSK